MKFISTTLLALFLYATNSFLYAQDVSYGLKGSFVFSDLIFQSKLDNDFYVESHSPRPSLALNAVLTFPVSPKLGFNIMPGFIQKGSQFDNPAIGNYNMKFNYLHMPIHLSYSIKDNFKFTFGPEMGYMVSARSRFDGKNQNIKHIVDHDLELAGSVSFALRVKNTLWTGIAYSRGLSSVYSIRFTDNTGLVLSDTKIYNHSFNLFFTYEFKPKQE